MDKLGLAWREIEHADSLLSEETLTYELLLDYLMENPNKIAYLQVDSRYRKTILKFKEGGLI